MTSIKKNNDMEPLCNKNNNCNNNDICSEMEFSSTMISKDELPVGATLLETQVAGHVFDSKKRSIGILKDENGHVLKPAEKHHLGEREIDFYNTLQYTIDPIMQELRQYTPVYYGTKEMRVLNKRIKFLELKDISEGMSEPCIMDIKIGRRTWDPLAAPEKRANEEKKYAESKKAYGFCIPGFQVYQLPSGHLKKFGKDYGKKLNEKTVIEAFQMFLNAAPNRLPCRELVIKLLSIMWKILSLVRSQKKYRFYSSSLLIAYDAKHLRHFMRTNEEEQRRKSPSISIINRSNTFSCLLSNTDNHSPENSVPLSTSHSIKNFLSSSHPPRKRAVVKLQKLERSISLNNYEVPEKTSPSIRDGNRARLFETGKLCRTHSFENNFDADMAQMKEDYVALLAELSSTSEERQNWVRVNMIDFTHAFPAEDGNVDTNYLEGVENLVKLLESFLS